MKNCLKKLEKRWLFFPCLVAILAANLLPLNRVGATDTSLLFVGEDLSVLTIASRRAETPEKAPAVAQVITRKDIDRLGIKTLGEALSLIPGLYIAKREWGSQPYMRGVPDSILFLYDSVPLTSDSTKSVHPLDEELSLELIERIEIIRGPGSVLWGPDAFAGIINLVPRKGRELNGFKLNVTGASPNHHEKVDISWGRNSGLWEAYLAFSANRTSPWSDKFNVLKLAGDTKTPVPPEDRIGTSKVDDSYYSEGVFNFFWQDWLHFSARWSEAKRNYVLSDPEENLSWAGQRKTPFKFARLELKYPFDTARIRLNGYYNELNFAETEIDLSSDQKSKVSYVELLYDRELWNGQGLATFGTSYRHNRIAGAVISQSFLPDFLKPENTLFVPNIRQKNFNTSLTSFFAQFRNHWNHFDAWLGVRLDDHSQYRQTISHNMGLRYHPYNSWHLKLLYGTAFRTPYNQQLVGETHLDPEQVQNFTINSVWRPNSFMHVAASAFWNKIRHHIQEDPYGGLSHPSTADLYGIELEFRWQMRKDLTLWANGTFFSHSGDEEAYRLADFIIIRPDGSNETHFKNWTVPFDTGPKNLFNAGIFWKPWDNMDLAMRLRYAGTSESHYQEGTIKISSTPTWFFDVTVTGHDILKKGVDLQLAVKNLFDQKYHVAGTYSTIETDPLAAYCMINFRF